MEQQNINTVDTTPKRPAFLNILCILSFVGIGIAFISGIINLTQLDRNIETLKSFGGLLGGDTDSAVEALTNWGYTVYIITIVASLICLLGVIMMWKIKKTGFYIYVVGEIAPGIATIVLLGGFGTLGTLAIVGSLIFPIAFIIMYAINLKHML